MKKNLMFFIIIFVIAFLPITSFADSITDEIKEELSLENVENIPDESIDNADMFGEDLTFENTAAFFDVKKIFSFIFKVITDVLKTKKGYLYSLFSILLICFLSKNLGQGLSSEKTLFSVRNITVLLAAFSVFFPLFETVSDSVSYGEKLSSFSLSFLPVFLSLSGLSGSGAAAVGGYGTVVFAVELFSYLLSAFVPVLVSVFLAAGISSGFSEDRSMVKISRFSRNTVIAVMSFLFLLITSVAAIQNGLFSSVDTVSKKSIKYVVNSAVPIGGGFLSDGLDFVYTGISNVRKTCGAFATVIVFLMAAYPVCELIICGFLMKIFSTLSSVFQNRPLENFFSVSFDAYLTALSFVLGYFITVSVLFSVISNIGG